jgi:hypothetical protein
MTTVFPDGTSEQAAFLDAWRVRVIRAGEGLIEENGGTLGQTQATVEVEFSVELTAACEVLTIQVELSTSGQTWFRADGDHQVCAGLQNEIEITELEWVRPQPTVSPSALDFTVEEQQAATSSFTITYLGVDPLIWSAYATGTGVNWLGLEPSEGTNSGGGTVQVQVRADASDLTPGEYSKEIVVTGESFPDVIARIPVSLTVTERPKLGVSVATLEIAVTEGLNPDPRSFTVSNLGGGTLDWTAVDNAGWIALAPSTGTLGSGGSQVVSVSAATAQLQPGQYQAIITVSGVEADDSPQTILVSLRVIERPRLGVSTNALAFNVSVGSSPNPQSFVVSNEGGGSLLWSAVDNVGWLSLSPASGTLGADQSQLVTVSANTGQLQPGQYQATITVSGGGADDSPQTILVSLTVTLPPRIGLFIERLSYTADEGASPNPQQFILSNVGGGSLNWSATSNAAWLQLAPGNGVLGADQSQSITATVNSVGLKEGNYTAQITVSDAAAENSPQTIDVSLTIIRRFPPTIAEFAYEPLQINDPTCGNNGTRFEFYFVYSDPDGDILIAGDSLAGEPIELEWWFRPNGFSGSSFLTGGVDGTGFSGYVSFQLCIAYQLAENTSVDLTISLMDSGGRQSNTLFRNVPRPEGGNSPNLTVDRQVDVGSPGVAGQGGSIIVRRRGGGPG